MEKTSTGIKKTPLYKVALNLRNLPGAEETVLEGEDGERREGIFIPYEVNGAKLVYHSTKSAFVNIATIANNGRRRRTLPTTPNDLYTLHPYWTRQQREKMAEVGLERETVYLGKMTVIGYCGWDYRRDEGMGG